MKKTYTVGRFTFVFGLLIPWAVGVGVISVVFIRGLLSL